MRKLFIVFCLLILVFFFFRHYTQPLFAKRTYMKTWALAHEEKRYEEAILRFERIAIAHPSSHWAGYSLLQIGDCYLNLGKEGEARRSFQRTIEKGFDECIIKQAAGCLEHLDNHNKRYPLHLSGKCPLCRSRL